MTTLEEKVEQLEIAVRRLEKLARGNADAEVVRRAAAQELIRLKEEWRAERHALDIGAVRTLEQGIKRILDEFGEPLAVAKEIRAKQSAALIIAEQVKEAKLARDGQVVRVAKIVGVILVLAEIYRTIRP